MLPSSSASASAAACSARWRPATSAAASRTSRCSTSTASTTASLPIIGVNTFLRPAAGGERRPAIELARSTEAEKQRQLDRVRGLPRRHTPTRPTPPLDRLTRGGARRRQPLRRADGRRAGLLARRDHRRPLRGRRPVPPQRLTADDLGFPLSPAGPALRVVSLVPSLTEALASAHPERLDRCHRLVHASGRAHRRTGPGHQEPRPGSDP